MSNNNKREANFAFANNTTIGDKLLTDMDILADKRLNKVGKSVSKAIYDKDLRHVCELLRSVTVVNPAKQLEDRFDVNGVELSKSDPIITTVYDKVNSVFDNKPDKTFDFLDFYYRFVAAGTQLLNILHEFENFSDVLDISTLIPAEAVEKLDDASKCCNEKCVKCESCCDESDCESCVKSFYDGMDFLDYDDDGEEDYSEDE